MPAKPARETVAANRNNAITRTRSDDNRKPRTRSSDHPDDTTTRRQQKAAPALQQMRPSSATADQ
jgi:hypothetical protein